MKRNDFLLLAILVLVSVIAFSAVYLSLIDGAEYAVIFIDGDKVERLPIDVDTEYMIESENGYNLLVIKDGNVYISEASCPNHQCMRRGPLTDLTPIICAPNKVVVMLEEN